MNREVNREVIFKYVRLWMDMALTDTIEEEDDYRIQLTEIWEDQMFKVDRDALLEYFRPFMNRFYTDEANYQVLKDWGMERKNANQ